MEYVKKKDIEETLQNFIDARKNKNCSKTVIIERRVFEYALEIVRKAKVYDFNEKHL